MQKTATSPGSNFNRQGGSLFNQRQQLRVFQSARPRGARHQPAPLHSRYHRVSIRAPAWGATLATGLNAALFPVSIRAPAWGATRCRRKCQFLALCFNPRARVGRDDSKRPTNYQFWRFNPRARVGRDFLSWSLTATAGLVSIRAPAWGATDTSPGVTISPLFQSARPRGARHY